MSRSSSSKEHWLVECKSKILERFCCPPLGALDCHEQAILESKSESFGEWRQGSSGETSLGCLISVCVGACASGLQIKLFKGLISSGSMLSHLTSVSSPRLRWDHKCVSLFIQSLLHTCLTVQQSIEKTPKTSKDLFCLFIWGNCKICALWGVCQPSG